MSGKKPSFITGANAKIKVGGLTIGYAQDVSYNTTVTTIPIETMGRYEVVTNEPVAYFVEGTLSVIRYTQVATNMSGANPTGNGIGKWDFGSAGNASQHVDPGGLLVSQTWDLEIFQKFNASGAVETASVIKVHDARFTRKGGAINKRGVLVEQFAFNAILIDDDSFTASGSGDTDLSI